MLLDVMFSTCRLEAARSALLEENSTLKLEQNKQESLLATRQNHITELEERLTQMSLSTREWKDKFAESEEEKNNIQNELSKYVRY